MAHDPAQPDEARSTHKGHRCESLVAAGPALTVGSDSPILILPDQHQVHEVSGGDELHGGGWGGGSADAQRLSKQRGVGLPAGGLPAPTHAQGLGNGRDSTPRGLQALDQGHSELCLSVPTVAADCASRGSLAGQSSQAPPPRPNLALRTGCH